MKCNVNGRVTIKHPPGGEPIGWITVEGGGREGWGPIDLENTFIISWRFTAELVRSSPRVQSKRDKISSGKGTRCCWTTPRQRGLLNSHSSPAVCSNKRQTDLETCFVLFSEYHILLDLHEMCNNKYCISLLNLDEYTLCVFRIWTECLLKGDSAHRKSKQPICSVSCRAVYPSRLFQCEL